MKNRNRIVLTLALIALMVATLLSPAVWAAPAPAQSGRLQKLASPDAVPEGLSAPEWSSIRQQYEQQRHAAFPVDGGYQARNPGQQWQTRFDGRGFTVQPDPDRDRSPVAACTLAMEPLGFSETGRPVGAAATGDLCMANCCSRGFGHDWKPRNSVGKLGRKSLQISGFTADEVFAAHSCENLPQPGHEQKETVSVRQFGALGE